MLNLRKNKTTSISILENDFGTFPPNPIHSSLKHETITIRHTNKFKKFTSGSTYGTKILFLSIFSNKQHNHITLFREIIEKQKAIFKASLIAIKDNLSESKIAATIAIPIILILLAILLATLPLAILYISIKSGFSFSRDKTDPLGYFQPGIGYENIINISKKSIKNQSPDDSENLIINVISHENIHLIQSKLGRNITRKIKDDDLLRLVPIYSELDQESQEFYKYVFSDAELEARLHFIIVKFHKENGFIPTSFNEFIGMLYACRHFRRVFTVFTETKKMDDIKIPAYGIFEPDHTDSVNQLFDAMKMLYNKEAIGRFILEVFPALHANLLHVYGDEQAKYKMLNSIPNKDLFDKLYS